MNLSLKTTHALVVALTIFGANPCRATESSPAATPASQGFAAPAQAPSGPDIVGSWHGTVKSPAAEITLVLHVERGADGTLSAKLENAGNPTPLSDLKVTSGHLAFRIPRGNAAYEGDWDSAAQQWKGTLTSARGTAMALNFAQGALAPWQPPPDSEIARLITQRNAPRPGQGIVVGVLGPDGQRFVAGGTGAGAKFDRSTLFEIGSISKVFTSLILADMVNKGAVSLDDPAAKYLPAGHKVTERNGRQITLRDLSTHRSGLPRMADDMRPISDPDGPFADYDEKRLLAFLDRYQLTRAPGSEWEYSNLGVGLLGYLLTRAAHTDYETLLRDRITRPLHMNDTMITLPPTDAARLAPAFDAFMRPVKPWDGGILVGCVGIRSSAADLLTFAVAAMDPHSPIAPAVKTMLSVRVPGNSPQFDQALGWVVLHSAPGRELWTHSGRPADTVRRWHWTRCRAGPWWHSPTPRPSPQRSTSGSIFSSEVPSRRRRLHPRSIRKSPCRRRSSTSLSAAMPSALRLSSRSRAKARSCGRNRKASPAHPRCRFFPKRRSRSFGRSWMRRFGSPPMQTAR